MKRIKDPIHNYILLEDFFVRLVDTQQMQRLRFIKQLGTANLVYPGANHTRFEHSLGTYNLAKSFSEALGIEHREDFMAAALLHDIGHGPFSHVSDSIASKRGLDHIRLTCDMVKKSELHDVLDDAGLNVSRVVELIKGRPPHGCLLSGSIDVDRLDYLMRDSYYTGANFGYIDLGRLFSGASVSRNRIVVDESCIATVESILVFRSLMYPTVYYHHTVRIAGVMLEKAIEEEIEKGSMDIEEMMGMDDVSLVSLLRSEGNRMWGRIESRNLYKTICEFPYQGGPIEQIKDLGDDVIVDVIEPPIWREMEVNVLTGRGLRKIVDVSTLAKSLLSAQRDHYRVAVYAPKERREEVERAMRGII